MQRDDNPPVYMENLEKELGPQRFAIAILRAPDPFERTREASIDAPNGCRVHRWDGTLGDTGK